MLQIASDGGLLEAPVARSSFPLHPAERIEVLVDFRAFRPGSEIVLQNTAGEATTTKSVMRFDVVDGGGARRRGCRAGGCARSRSCPRRTRRAAGTSRCSTSSGVQWQIANRGFDPSRIDVAPRLGTSELWQWHNPSNRVHPMHLHGMLFRVVERSSGVIHPGERAWKDTVGVLPGRDGHGPAVVHPLQRALRLPLPCARARRQGDDAAAGGGPMRRSVALAIALALARRAPAQAATEVVVTGHDTLGLGQADVVITARRQRRAGRSRARRSSTTCGCESPNWSDAVAARRPGGGRRADVRGRGRLRLRLRVHPDTIGRHGPRRRRSAADRPAAPAAAERAAVRQRRRLAGGAEKAALDRRPPAARARVGAAQRVRGRRACASGSPRRRRRDVELPARRADGRSASAGSAAGTRASPCGCAPAATASRCGPRTSRATAPRCGRRACGSERRISHACPRRHWHTGRHRRSARRAVGRRPRGTGGTDPPAAERGRQRLAARSRDRRGPAGGTCRWGCRCRTSTSRRSAMRTREVICAAGADHRPPGRHAPGGRRLPRGGRAAAAAHRACRRRGAEPRRRLVRRAAVAGHRGARVRQHALQRSASPTPID